MSEDTYQSRFLDSEDDQVFRALDLVDRINTELSAKGSVLSVYLNETRAAAQEAMVVLERCEPKDADTVTKAQADIRAYRRLREWISARLQDGDRAYADSDNPAGDDLPEDDEGFIPIAD